MSDADTYGYSLGCVSRRLFLLYLSLLGSVLCVLQILRWIYDWEPLYTFLSTSTERIPGCVGLECSAVFTCLGMKETTLHMREPLTTVGGAIFFPIGFRGANHGLPQPVKQMGYYLLAAVLLQLVVLAGDYAYISSCNAYSFNVVDWTLLSWPSPVSLVVREQLQQLELQKHFPLMVQTVDGITNNFNTMHWYYVEVFIWLAILAYTAKEALTFGWMNENGPIGMGTWFGLGQWDEVINHDAIRVLKEKDMQSQFVEDANTPLMRPLEDASRGYPIRAPKGYGYGTIMEDLEGFVEQLTPDAAKLSRGLFGASDGYNSSEDATQAPASYEKAIPRSEEDDAEVGPMYAESEDDPEEQEAEAARMLAERRALEALGY